MAETDLQYYERRHREEQALAAGSTSPEAASAHRVLSLIYAEEIRRLKRTVTVRLVQPRLT